MTSRNDPPTSGALPPSAGAPSRFAATGDGEEIRPVFAPGDRFRQYEVIRLVGHGGSGQVYEVVHKHTGRPFALKVMHLEDTRDSKKVARALAAAKGTYRVQHANVLAVHDVDCEESGMVWILSDLL